jgi:hypothetical protein
MSYESMLNIWFWYLLISFCINIVVVVWVTIGGCYDLRYLFKVLKEERVDDTDNGQVTESYTLSEEGSRNADLNQSLEISKIS